MAPPKRDKVFLTKHERETKRAEAYQLFYVEKLSIRKAAAKLNVGEGLAYALRRELIELYGDAGLKTAKNMYKPEVYAKLVTSGHVTDYEALGTTPLALRNQKAKVTSKNYRAIHGDEVREALKMLQDQYQETLDSSLIWCGVKLPNGRVVPLTGAYLWKLAEMQQFRCFYDRRLELAFVHGGRFLATVERVGMARRLELPYALEVDNNDIIISTNFVFVAQQYNTRIQMDVEVVKELHRLSLEGEAEAGRIKSHFLELHPSAMPLSIINPSSINSRNAITATGHRRLTSHSQVEDMGMGIVEEGSLSGRPIGIRSWSAYQIVVEDEDEEELDMDGLLDWDKKPAARDLAPRAIVSSPPPTSSTAAVLELPSKTQSLPSVDAMDCGMPPPPPTPVFAAPVPPPVPIPSPASEPTTIAAITRRPAKRSLPKGVTKKEAARSEKMTKFFKTQSGNK